MPKSKLSAVLSLVLVFLSGALVGVVGYRLYMVKSVSSSGVPVAQNRRPADPEEVRKHLISEMRDRVRLDAAQVEKLNVIYDETRQAFDALHKKANSETRALWENQTERIKAILRPEQVALYEQLRAERETERKRRHEHDGGRGPGGRGPGGPGGPPPAQ
jgi:hypothetical protein